MLYTTTYLGQFTLDPPLAPYERAWVAAFAEWGGGPTGDPFTLPMNPRASWQESGRRPPDDVGIPLGVLDWVPCYDGCHLAWRRCVGTNDAILALRFVIDHFLGPRAIARGKGEEFERFTFDHRVSGVVAARREDTEELFLIRAEDSRLRRETLDPGRSGAGVVSTQDGPGPDPDWGTVASRSGSGAPGEVTALVRPRGRGTRSRRG